MPFKLPFWSPSQAVGILFDWDGVIAETRLDFSEIRDRYYPGRKAMLLEDAETLPETERMSLMRDLERLEVAGAEIAEPVAGITGVLGWVKEMRIPWAVVSRNCRKSILTAADRIGVSLPPIVRSREDGDCVKPAPRALTETALRLGAAPMQTLFVGDYIYDMMGARRAGMRGVLVRKKIEESWRPWLECHYTNMTQLASELRAPSELIPWEYQETAEEMGRDFLSFAASLTLALPERASPSLDRWLTRAASLGVRGFLVPDEILTPAFWKANPALDPAHMGHSLETAVREFLRVRYPFAMVSNRAETSDGEAIITDAPLDADGLRGFIARVREQRGV